MPTSDESFEVLSEEDDKKAPNESDEDNQLLQQENTKKPNLKKKNGPKISVSLHPNNDINIQPSEYYERLRTRKFKFQKSGKTAIRLIEDILRLSSIDASNNLKYLSSPTIDYSDKISTTPKYGLTQLDPPLNYAPDYEIRDGGKIQILRALIYNDNDLRGIDRSFRKYFHLKMTLFGAPSVIPNANGGASKSSTSSNSSFSRLYDFHYVDMETTDHNKNSMHMNIDENNFDTTNFIKDNAFPKIVEKAFYKCSKTNVLLEIIISESEFSDEDLNNFELDSIQNRIESFENLTNQKVNTVLKKGYPSQAMCFYTLFKILRNPLLQKPNDEKKTIAFNNHTLNIRLNPKILSNHLFYGDYKRKEWIPPFFNELNDKLSEISKESFIRKTQEIISLGIMSDTIVNKQIRDNPFSFKLLETESVILRLKQFLSCDSYEKSTTTVLKRDHYSDYVKLGIVEDFSDKLIVSSYELQSLYDPDNIPDYADAIRNIAQFTGSQILEDYVIRLMSLGIITRTDILKAYRYFNVLPQYISKISDDMLIESIEKFITNYNEPTDSNYLFARGQLSILSNVRKSKTLKTYLDNQLIPLNLAYEALDSNPSFDDSKIMVAYLTKRQQNNPHNIDKINQALISISSYRGSYPLLNYIETQIPDINKNLPKLSISDSLNVLGINGKIDDLVLINLFKKKILNQKINPYEIRKFRNSLRFIAIERKSEILLDFLKNGTVNDDYITAFDWPVGLQNIGNTCYLNSLLQYYFAIKPLRDAIANFNPSTDHDINDQLLSKRRIGGRKIGKVEIDRSRAFMLFMKELFQQLIHTHHRYISPKPELAYLAFSATRTELEMLEESNSSKGTTDFDKDGSNLDVELTDERFSSDSNSDDVMSLSDTPTNPSDNEPFIHKSTSTNINKQTSQKVVSINTSSIGHKKTSSGKSNFVVLSTATQRVNVPVNVEVDDIFDSFATSTQQDVTECIENVLFQIESVLPPLSIDEENEQIDIIKNLFYGKTKQELIPIETSSTTQTPKNKKKREKEERFSSILVNVSDKPKTLYSALDYYFRGDSLRLEDGKVKRRLTISQLPPILQIQIQRVGFDKEKGVAFKNNSRLVFPETLYMDRYTDGSQDEELKQQLENISTWKETQASLKRQRKYLGKRLGHNGMTFRESLNETLHWLESRVIEKSGITVKDSAIEELREQLNIVDVESRTIEEQIVQMGHNIEHELSIMTKIKYHLFAVFIHRGEANFGHYWVYIRDFKNDVYREYNDETVSEVSIDQIMMHKNGTTATPYFLVYVRDGNEDQLVETLKREMSQYGLENGSNSSSDEEFVDVTSE